MAAMTSSAPQAAAEIDIEHKVRSGSGALEALVSFARGSDGVPSVPALRSDDDAPPKSTAWQPPATPPVDIVSPIPRQSPTRGSSGRLSFLSACFSAASATLDDDAALLSAPCAECEVGIRPSFYWVDAPASEEQRAEAEISFRFIKGDCQDEATVLHNFAGVPGLVFVGVFDGHGPHGRAAAKFASEHIPATLVQNHATALRSKSERKKLKALREACAAVDAAMRHPTATGFDASMSGTTACFALVVPASGSGSRSSPRLLVANVGDSRCVVARRGADSASASGRSDRSIEAIPLTVDAKPALEKERARIVACGGVVRQMLDERGQPRGAHRVFGRGDDVLPGLAMSRSLGDGYAHAVGVTWEPTLSAHSLSPGKDVFLVLGSDGLWDVMSNEDTVDFIDRYRCARDPGVSCAEALTLEAQERWKAAHDEAVVDDISVVILHFVPLPPVGRPPNPKRGMSQRMSRAASCNDEANAMSAGWRLSSASGEAATRGAAAYGSHGTANVNKETEPNAVTTNENPSHRSPRSFFQHLYRNTGESGSGDFWDAVEARQGSLNSSGVSASGDSARDGSLDGVGAVVSKPIAHSNSSRDFPPPGLPRPPSSSSEATSPPSSPAVTRTIAVTSAATTIAASRTSNVIPIPAARMRTAGRVDSLAMASAPAAILSDPHLRPIRKAYPSSTQAHHHHAMHSVPSWDGAFASFASFHSHESLLAVGVGGHVGDATTPRSTESDRSLGGLGGANGDFRFGRRCEMRHEGKVRRGIPMSLSSIGLAGAGRSSVDGSDHHSDRQTSSSVQGSVDDGLGLLGASLSLSLSRSLPGATSMARAASHGSLRSPGKVMVVRDVHAVLAAGGSLDSPTIDV